jgi:hypothetical protein
MPSGPWWVVLYASEPELARIVEDLIAAKAMYKTDRAEKICVGYGH